MVQQYYNMENSLDRNWYVRLLFCLYNFIDEQFKKNHLNNLMDIRVQENKNNIHEITSCFLNTKVIIEMPIKKKKKNEAHHNVIIVKTTNTQKIITIIIILGVSNVSKTTKNERKYQGLE